MTHVTQSNMPLYRCVECGWEKRILSVPGSRPTLGNVIRCERCTTQNPIVVKAVLVP